MQPPHAQPQPRPMLPEAERREAAATTGAQAIAVQALPARQRFALSETSLASPHAGGDVAQARMSSLLKEVCVHGAPRRAWAVCAHPCAPRLPPARAGRRARQAGAAAAFGWRSRVGGFARATHL